MNGNIQGKLFAINAMQTSVMLIQSTKRPKTIKERKEQRFKKEKIDKSDLFLS